MANSIFRSIVLTLLATVSALAQENRYMVFFKDKTGVPFTTSQPVHFLSEKAIDRRLKQGIDITESDLPVQHSYVQGVRNAGARTYFTTRWLNGVLIECDAALLASVQSLPYVDRVEFVAPETKLQAGGRRSSNLRRKNNTLGSETENQLQMLGIDHMHRADYKGKGVSIAVLDSGFPGVDTSPAFAHIFGEGRFAESVSYDFVHNTSDVFQFDDHGTEVLSVISAVIPDAFTGGAFEATFQLFVTEDVPSEFRVEEYNWLFAAEKADSAGVDIIHSSLGYYDFDDAAMNYTVGQMDGKTTVVSRAAQWAADRGIVVITSAGNEGGIPSWRIVTAPADAEDVIAVGAVNSALQKTGSSSFGPSADNRIKPDVVALGVGVKVVRANGQISTASGTSLAAPLITSLVAGILQRYPELTNREIIHLLKQTSSQAKNPDNLLGFGIPSFQAMVDYHEHAAPIRIFEVFPNPLKDDTLTISPYDPNLVGSCEIEIVSTRGQVLGRETARFDLQARNHKTDISGLASGIYYVRVFWEKRRHTFKLVRL